MNIVYVLITITVIALILNGILLRRVIKNERINATTLEEIIEQQDEECVYDGGYDVTAFRERMKNMRESIEMVDGVPLYDVTTVIVKDDASGVEIVTNDVEMAIERKSRR